MMEAWRITWFTLLCATGATLLIRPPGVALAWVLVRRQFPGRAMLESVVTLPLVVPPVAHRRVNHVIRQASII